MRRKLLAATLALCMALTLAVPALASGSAASLEDAVQAVNALGIVDQTENLSAKVSRAEFVAMAIKASPGGDGVGQASSSPYPDVPRTHWASGYVEAAVSRGMVSAFSDGTFRPEREITLAEAAGMVLTLLGYSQEDFSGAYPTGQLSMLRSLKLDRGMTAASAASSLSRQDAVYLFYNLLSARTKEGTPYIQLLGHSLDASGKPDLVSLVNGEMEGPVVVQSGWQRELGFVPAKVYRNNSAAALDNIQNYDIVYWNASMGTVWAYAKKATGTIQAIEPSGAAPTSVTVAGRTYAIESSAAAYALSDLGQYHLGSTVTLLLGRSGGVAAVADVSASAGERIGVVLEAVKSSHPDGDGGTYSAQTVTILATDGQTYQYQAGGNYQAGNVVRATVAAKEGTISLRGLSAAALEGTVSADGTKLGQYAFAPGAEILDVGNKQGVVISPERLAGLKLDRSKVRYYALNPQGEIETLILSDVTGDAYHYGVLTQFEEQGEGTSKFFSYEYDVEGTTYTLPGTTTRFLLEGAPIRVVGELTNPDRLYSLTSAGTGELVDGRFAAGNRKYTLSDQVAVYEFRGNRYYLSSLARAEEEGRTLTAWYDKEESQGGRIRVIIVK